MSLSCKNFMIALSVIFIQKSCIRNISNVSATCDFFLLQKWQLNVQNILALCVWLHCTYVVMLQRFIQIDTKCRQRMSIYVGFEVFLVCFFVSFCFCFFAGIAHAQNYEQEFREICTLALANLYVCHLAVYACFSFIPPRAM